MDNKTTLTEDIVIKAASSTMPYSDGHEHWQADTGALMEFARRIEQAVLQSPEMQRQRKNHTRWESFLKEWVASGLDIDGVWFIGTDDFVQYIDAQMEK